MPRRHPTLQAFLYEPVQAYTALARPAKYAPDALLVVAWWPYIVEMQLSRWSQAEWGCGAGGQRE